MLDIIKQEAEFALEIMWNDEIDLNVLVDSLWEEGADIIHSHDDHYLRM